jgi:AcrR family transcriptional regulator
LTQPSRRPAKRDAERTRRRIFDAATAEFAAHGIAGARIDRIAARAGANKQLIYAYFGNKRELFEAVVAEHVTRFLDEVPFDAERLPEYAAAAFDFFTTHADIVQLGSWHALEPGEREHRIPVIERAVRRRATAIARAQRTGAVTSAIGAADLGALTLAIAQAWAAATPERDPRGGPGPRLHKRRRAAVEEAVRRLVEPARGERRSARA